MKTLHVTYGFPPDPPGGTELYVEALCRELERLGIQSIVTAPGPHDAEYRHDGLTVRRFGSSGGEIDLEDLYGGGDPRAAAAFERILDAERPDLVHQHALTAACSGQLIRLSKARGLPVVFTYHTPAVSCQRGTLLEGGSRPCDGRVSVSRCTPCTLQNLGLDHAASRVVARTPEVAGDMLGKAGFDGGAWTALRMRSLMRRRVDHLSQVLSDVDVFVAVTPWVRALLCANGVPDARITDSTHGVFESRPGAAARAVTRSGAPLRIAHLGRLDPGKGTRILVEAVQSAADADLSLDLFGVVQNTSDAHLLSELQAAAAADPRIRFLPAIPHAAVVRTLASYDLVAVPSQGFETGPLVVLEAFAAGVPVLGSAIGGIAEKVQHGTSGWLVQPHDSREAWRAALTRCAMDRDLITRLATGVPKPRTMADVAQEMKAVYRSQLSAARRSESA